MQKMEDPLCSTKQSCHLQIKLIQIYWKKNERWNEWLKMKLKHETVPNFSYLLLCSLCFCYWYLCIFRIQSLSSDVNINLQRNPMLISKYWQMFNSIEICLPNIAFLYKFCLLLSIKSMYIHSSVSESSVPVKWQLILHLYSAIKALCRKFL